MISSFCLMVSGTAPFGKFSSFGFLLFLRDFLEMLFRPSSRLVFSSSSLNDLTD